MEMEKEYLILLLVIAVIVILALVAALVFYRRKLARCKASLVRCINENIEMKQKLPDYELPHFIMRDELTAEEFVQIIHNMMKRLMFVASLLVLFILPVSAHADYDNYTVIYDSNSQEFHEFVNKIARTRNTSTPAVMKTDEIKPTENNKNNN